jgi:hypothetical protein
MPETPAVCESDGHQTVGVTTLVVAALGKPPALWAVAQQLRVALLSLRISVRCFDCGFAALRPSFYLAR